MIPRVLRAYISRCGIAELLEALYATPAQLQTAPQLPAPQPFPLNRLRNLQLFPTAQLTTAHPTPIHFHDCPPPQKPPLLSSPLPLPPSPALTPALSPAPSPGLSPPLQPPPPLLPPSHSPPLRPPPPAITHHHPPAAGGACRWAGAPPPPAAAEPRCADRAARYPPRWPGSHLRRGRGGITFMINKQ